MIGRLSFAIAFLAVSFPAPARAQSFDCAKATSGAERLICSERALGALDEELAGEVKKALAAAADKREGLLADERKWVKDRDRTCAVPAGALQGEARTRAVACLTASYRERIGVLRSAVGEDGTGDARAKLCRTLGDRYRALLQRDPKAPYKKSFYAESPLTSLAAGGAGATVSAKAELGEYSRRKLADWAKREQPPFAIPSNVSKEIDEIAHSYLSVDRLPGTSFYAASVIEGTAACYYSVYFEAARGRAALAHGPSGWEGENSEGCGISRSFGKIDETPVAFEERHDYTPSLSSGVSVTPWTGKGFGPECLVTFEFAPRFDPRGTYNEWEEDCAGEDCDALRREALALVETVQKNPLEAEKAALARLTAAQRADFADLKKQAGAKDEGARSDAENPSSYLYEDPLLLPLVFEGRLYLAGVGHFTIGWRIFSDWSVTLRRLENGKIADRATFAIGMTKGRLEKVSVK